MSLARAMTESDDMQPNEFVEPRESRKCTRHKWGEAWRWFEDPDKSGPGCARCKRGRHWECHGCSCPCSLDRTDLEFRGWSEARWEAEVDKIAPRVSSDVPWDDRERCLVCGRPKDEAVVRRGKQSRNYGNRAELKVANKYGGTKIGHAGGPVDVRGKDFATQVKTHRRLPPAEWRKSFAAMAQDARCPRMLLRFVQTGTAPVDYFVFQADDFLQWFGKDE